MRSRKSCALFLAAVAVALAGCGDKPQGAGRVRKADASPATGANPAYAAPGWKAGDAASWEQQMRARAQNQNEYAKTAGGN